jgi:hypothetical protein
MDPCVSICRVDFQLVMHQISRRCQTTLLTARYAAILTYDGLMQEVRWKTHTYLLFRTYQEIASSGYALLAMTYIKGSK